PDVRISHIYASTEAGVGFSVNDRKPGFPLGFLSAPPSGIELRVVDNRLFVRNRQVDSHYVGTDSSIVDPEGWVDTGDVVETREDRVYFLGRASGVINVGGNKVHPERVERVLLSHPSVVQARAFAKSNPLSGALVAAEVVLTEGTPATTETRQALLTHAGRQLGRHEVPVSIRFVDRLEMNAVGKMVRR
ncbi:MAG TPA: hypothetical protein VD788_15865, partial [Candidatus Polarisedimenticolaceae bacterium]|nr:hypothetical protein [Candidatus Polarisedimenticolaceae bacterium]